MLHRVVAVLGYPAHFVNRVLAGALGRIGLARIPGALVVGVGLMALTVSTAAATIDAFARRPEPQPSSVAAIVGGRVGSGLWVTFDAVRIEGPHRAMAAVTIGGVPTPVERIYYLVVDPADPDRALILRAREPVAELDSARGAIRIDGTITEDPFNLSSLLEEWAPAERHPALEFSETRLLAYGFARPYQEPSWLGTGIVAVATAFLLGGAFVRQPLLRLGPPGRGAVGATPIALTIHGHVETPRGRVRVDGTPAQLDWMSVEEVARTRWRYWGAALGDVRQQVEDAVRAHGAGGRQLVVHGRTGSLLWPVGERSGLRLEVGEAHLGLGRHPAIRIRGSDVDATLTFADAGSRDAALAELEADDAGS